MLADIEPGPPWPTAVEELRASQVRAEGRRRRRHQPRLHFAPPPCRTIARFGKVHIVCNNAGVLSGGALQRSARA